MSSLTEFDIVGVTPHVDLVLFDNVISCYTYNQNITANYVLGEAVRPSIWDWVGIFPIDWQYLGQYVSYRWAPDSGPDCTAPRRRAVCFKASSHNIQPDRRTEYQLLYIANGNHVAGVSVPFRVIDEPEMPDLFLGRLFHEPCIQKSRVAKRKAARRKVLQNKKHRLASAHVVLVDETRCGGVPKTRAARKQKMTNVYRDHTTLTNLGNTDWTSSLQIMQVDEEHPVVREYSTALMPYQGSSKQLQVYDTQWSDQGHALLSLEMPDVPKLEYPSRLSLPAGPLTFALALQAERNPCSSCNMAKSLVHDFTVREEALQDKVASLEKQLKDALNTNIKEKHMQMCKNMSSSIRSDGRDTRSLLDWCLKQVQKDNLNLRVRNAELETLLAAARREKPAQDVPLIQRLANPIDEHDKWLIMEPKRIVRFKKVIGKQSRNIHILKEALHNKQTEAAKLREDNSNLRKFLQTTQNNAENFRRMTEDLETRIRAVLAERSADGVNEWRIQKPIQETSTTQTTTQEPEVSTATFTQKSRPRDHIKNKQISKLLKSERKRKTKLHKEKSQAEQCSTCGLKFSMKADRMVIEEHMTYHRRFQS